MATNFKTIHKVPEYKDFMDFTLSKTQRKTPTVVHRHFAIARIRSFYMRKVKFTQQTLHDRLTTIVEDFPKIDELHPFHSDLFNILYEKDHYKVALSQINRTRNVIDNISKEYIRLLKYGDSMYRCKCLKRVALGRMMSSLKKLDKVLVYLEEVRQHMTRLPSIDPNMRTIILAGFPNVGKSSFMNKVTRAEVDVQPYPFTTKSIFVGHTEYNYLRFQVIDTPGILDQSLEKRNTIEMQSITAMAHLQACIIFMMDLSESCGYSISEQLNLWDNLKPLFTNKPLVLGLNKADAMPFENVSEENKQLLQGLQESGTLMSILSTMTGQGVMELRKVACDSILELRVAQKAQSKKVDNILNRLHVAIPEGYVPNSRTRYLLPEKFGVNPLQNVFEAGKIVIPEIMDGKNISDFVDVNIKSKMMEILHEEKLREEAGFYEIVKYTDKERDIFNRYKELMDKKKWHMMEHNDKKQHSKGVPRNIFLKTLAKRDKLLNVLSDNEDTGDNDDAAASLRGDRNSQAHELKMAQSGVVGEKVKKVRKLELIRMNKLKKDSRKGEADRHVYDLKPKHLHSGKRTVGKTQRR